MVLVGPVRDRPQSSRLGCVGGPPKNLDGIDQIGQTLQMQRAVRGESMLATSTHHQPHHVRREDLTAFARRAESGGLDHRSAEVIALLLTHFTGAQSHTQTDRMVPVEVLWR